MPQRLPRSVGGSSFAADAGDPDQVDAAFARCVEELGGVDVAFLNAGIAIGVADLTALDEATYRRIMRVNVDGVVFGLRAAIRAMTERGGGAIVATARSRGSIPFPPDPGLRRDQARGRRLDPVASRPRWRRSGSLRTA